VERDRQHTQEPSSDGQKARAPVTLRSLVSDWGAILGITVSLATLVMFPMRLMVLVLLTSLLLMVLLGFVGDRPIAEVAAPFMRATGRLGEVANDLASASWRLLIACLLALALVITQASEVVRDRLEPSPALDVAIADLSIAALQASNTLRAMLVHNRAMSARTLAMLQATSSARQASNALRAMSARNLAMLKATAFALAHARRALNTSRRAHGQTSGGPASLAVAVASARQASDALRAMLVHNRAVSIRTLAMLQPTASARQASNALRALSARSSAMFQATVSALAHASRALAAYGLVTTPRYVAAVRP
jgi:hypothetical protein